MVRDFTGACGFRLPVEAPLETVTVASLPEIVGIL
jgi:hypothetical protein